MPEELIHKLYAPNRIGPVSLKELVLCARNDQSVILDDIMVNNSINHTTCLDCWTLWKEGIYV